MSNKDEIEKARANRARDFVTAVRQVSRAISPQSLIAPAGIDLSSTSQSVVQTPLPRPATASRSDRDNAFVSVRAARTLRNDKKNAVISERSRVDYGKKVKHLLVDKDDYATYASTETWKLALSRYANNSSSFRANRTAACWFLAQQIDDLLSRQDKSQRDLGHTVNWLALCRQLAVLCDTYKTIMGWTRDSVQPVGPLRRRIKHTKAKDLVKIEKTYPDWRQRMNDALADSQFIDALLVMELVGCRPSELVSGVGIHLSEPGGFTVRVLKGAKVTESSGQPWRTASFPLSKLPARWSGILNGQMSYRVSIDSTDELRNVLQRTSRKLLPGVPYVTAYVYRHALASEMRESGFQAEEMAKGMGHRVPETQAFYGRKHSGKRKPVVDVNTAAKFEAPLPVRELDRTTLNEFRAKKQKVGKKPTAH